MRRTERSETWMFHRRQCLWSLPLIVWRGFPLSSSTSSKPATTIYLLLTCIPFLFTRRMIALGTITAMLCKDAFDEIRERRKARKEKERNKHGQGLSSTNAPPQAMPPPESQVWTRDNPRPLQLRSQSLPPSSAAFNHHSRHNQKHGTVGSRLRRRLSLPGSLTRQTHSQNVMPNASATTTRQVNYNVSNRRGELTWNQMVAHRHNLSQLDYGTHERILSPPPAYTPIAMGREADDSVEWDEVERRDRDRRAVKSRRVRFSDGHLELPPLYHAGTMRQVEMPNASRRATISVVGEEREDDCV
ncbi:hypothetical protein BKA70DRAFT_469493 [Coprinopsis sp. MPI-PUGE-AT-0042]|nr:hypothetical protein BKA70DRAFT_469493 [Coprinopsis sp. MPI-PUGE-AT-0042]